jgi:FkbM family methyltransferase
MSIIQAAKARVGRLLPGGGLRRTIASGPLEGMVLRLPSGWDELYAPGGYEPDVAAALTRLVEPGDTCVDAGAHYGYFTLLLAKLCGPGGHVYSFEAEADNARVLRQNVRANRLQSRVSVERAAVAAREGEVELHASATGGSTEWTLLESFALRGEEQPTNRTAERTPAIRLDAYLADAPRFDVLKMDIEGAEAEVIPTISELLERRRPAIVLEFHREVGWPAIEALVDGGYELEGLDGTPLPRPRSADEVPYQLVARPHQ